MNLIRNNFKILILVIILAINIIIWPKIIRNQNGELSVYFLNIGQGDSVFIETPNGKQILIDGGPDDKVLRELGEIMPFYDRSIDLILASNNDSDHIAGLVKILNRYSVDSVIETGVISESSVYKEFEEQINNRKINKIIARRGMIIDFGDGVNINIIFPDRDVSGISTNDGSLVAKLIYGKTSALFTGDLPEKMEDFIISTDKAKLKSDILKVGHHGSKTSTSEMFLGFVDPEFSIISVGASNKYGHPSSEVLERLNSFGSKIFRTDLDGRILFISDGEEYRNII